MPNVIGVSADAATLAHWYRLVVTAGVEPVVVPLLGTVPRPVESWLVVLDRQMPLPYVFWLRSLCAPITLVSSSINAAQSLLDRVPLIRVLCHTSRAMVSLSDVLTMSEHIKAGTLVLEPVTPNDVRSARVEAVYA
jgi:hypothetical protein